MTWFFWLPFKFADYALYFYPPNGLYHFSIISGYYIAACCDDVGHVYISDLGNERLLVLDGDNGRVLHVEQGLTGREHFLLWHDGKLVVCDMGATETISFYAVDDM